MSEQSYSFLSGRIKTVSDNLERHRVHEVGPTLGELYSMFLGLPALRGYWPMSSQTQAAGDLVYDLAGQDRHLTRVGAEFAVYNGLIPYADYNGTTDYLTRADETGLDITGALTMLGWFWLDSITGDRPFVAKWGGAAATRSYLLDNSGGTARLALSTGAAVTVYAGSTVTTSAWHFIAGRFTPSTTADIWVNGTKTTNVSAIAALGNSASPFRIGNNNDGNFLDGRSAPVALCATALSDTLINMIFQRSRTAFDT